LLISENNPINFKKKFENLFQDSFGLHPQNNLPPSLPLNLLTDQFFINQNNNLPQQPKRSISTVPQSSTTTASAPSSLETDSSAAANFGF